jgi:hypothetical protein
VQTSSRRANILCPGVVIEPWEGDYWLQPLVAPRLGTNSCYRPHGILKIVDHVAHARKLRYNPLSVLSDSLRSHVPRQRNHPAIGLHVMALAAPDVSWFRANAA